MRHKFLTALVIVALVALGSTGASAKSADPVLATSDDAIGHGMPFSETSSARLETLWIFDADYEDLVGDNAGWTVYDRSGTLGATNFWHHDTIHMTGYPYLGDSTWWCGTVSPCWRQARGYGNDWLQILERHFTESSTATTSVILDYDQRYAMENDYDYGYVDVRSSATGDTWYTVFTISNPGFAGQPGSSQDWNSVHPQGGGHMTLDITPETMGVEFDLRYRFESDGAYSSQDQWNNPPFNSCLDGAWQLDNITLTVDGSPAFVDDAESGNMGWMHDDMAPAGQTGVTFWRGRFGIDFVTGRAFTCDDRPFGSWMYASVDPFTSQFVDYEWTWLMSPPIDISGAEKLVGSWDYWLDMPSDSDDLYNIYLASDDNQACVTDPDGFVDEDPGWWFGGPYWNIKYDDWDAFAGNDWLAIMHAARNDYDGEAGPHMAGYWVNRTRLGIPSGDAGTQFDIDIWNNFNDWYQEQLADALLDTAELTVADDDNVASVMIVASNDAGQTWESYSARRENPESNLWYVPPPANQMTPGSEIWYYYSAIDGVGNTATYPDDAPSRYFEISILPINGTVSEPGLLLVDKHRRLTPGEDRNYLHTSQYYFREMLNILGYEWDCYEVEVESGSIKSEGPDSVGYKYYDTQIWFTNRFDTRTIKPFDQANMISWLQQSGEGKERNLLITGNNWGTELMATGRETLSFYETWLASNYLDNEVGAVTVDSVPTLRDYAGGFDFMTYDDGECILRGGCPYLHEFDVAEPYAGISGAEQVADYVKVDTSTRPAGVAYTHATLGYQTVNLPFGMEFMMDSMLPSGYYETGIQDRVNLLDNIMDYFGRLPDGPGTGVVDGGFRNALSNAYPNPFNPVTKIAYSVKDAGRVTIEVYNVAGKVVRTLLDTDADAGASGYVLWDGANDEGERCASGVYFYRIAAPGFTSSRKMVMLK